MHKNTKSHIARTLKLSAIIAIGLSAAACSNSQMSRGYLFDPDLADNIAPGVDNRQSVETTLGTPSLRATFDDDTWYYVNTTVKRRSIFLPKPVKRRVMKVRFAENGTVAEVSNYDLSHARNIDPINDITPTRGRKLNFFQQLFMNVGRFSGSAPVGSQGGSGPNGS